MMTLSEIADALKSQSSEDGCFQECYDAIMHNIARPIGDHQPGNLSVRDALGTWTIRQRTTQQAGTSTLGFESTLEKLATKPSSERLLGFGLDAQDRVFVLFIAEDRHEIVGCIRVIRRPNDGPNEFSDNPYLNDGKPRRIP